MGSTATWRWARTCRRCTTIGWCAKRSSCWRWPSGPRRRPRPLHTETLEQEFAAAEQALRDGHPDEAAAAADVRAALHHLAEATDGPRVATPLYLDTIGAASGRLAVALVGFRDQVELMTAPGAAPSGAAEAAWRALGVAAGAGDPSQFSHSHDRDHGRRGGACR